MEEDLKALQKKEAIERLKILNKQYKLLSNIITEFDKENILNYSEYLHQFCPAILYWVSNREDLTALVNEVEEKKKVLVYHAILTPTTDGTYFSMLYISKHQEEWENDKTDLKEGYPLAYCINLADPQNAEFGGIQIRGIMGGIQRLA